MSFNEKLWRFYYVVGPGQIFHAYNPRDMSVERGKERIHYDIDVVTIKQAIDRIECADIFVCNVR
jgi:hypothetical protein